MKIIKDIVRTEDGYYLHPEFWDFDGKDFVTQTEWENWLDSKNVEEVTMYLENSDSEFAVEYFQKGEHNLSAWQEFEPEGEGWFTGAIYDTEDGPVWIWLRNKEDK